MSSARRGRRGARDDAPVIPIANLYYLLCYAWDLAEVRGVTRIAPGARFVYPELLAKLLLDVTRTIARQGVARGYVTRSETLPAPRGRVELSQTVARGLRARASVQCAVDALTLDTLPNQIILATARVLLRQGVPDPALVRGLERLRAQLVGVSEITLHPTLFRRVQVQPHRKLYRLAMHICQLVARGALAEPDEEGMLFSALLRDERTMSRVFERFVRRFYASEQRVYQVKRDRIRWALTPTDEASRAHLPVMMTDLTLRSAERTIVMDTKYYREALTEHFQQKRVRSEHLYQLHAYLNNLAPRGGPDARAEGILLYPCVGESLRLSYESPGHSMRVCTVDLGAPWQELHAELLSLVGLSRELRSFL